MQDFFLDVFPLRISFSAILFKNATNLKEITLLETNFKLFLKTTYKGFLKYQNKLTQGFVQCVWPLRMQFEVFLLKKKKQKNGHNSVKNYRIRKQFTLVLKTTYKKLFLK